MYMLLRKISEVSCYNNKILLNAGNFYQISVAHDVLGCVACIH